MARATGETLRPGMKLTGNFDRFDLQTALGCNFDQVGPTALRFKMADESMLLMGVRSLSRIGFRDHGDWKIVGPIIELEPMIIVEVRFSLKAQNGRIIHFYPFDSLTKTPENE